MLLVWLSVLSPSLAPGPVSGFSAVPMFTSIYLSWGRPENPNGEIISYEVTYRIGSGDIATENTTDLATNFTIQLLSPSTTVSNLSVTAYTRAGRGETRTREVVITPAVPILRKHIVLLVFQLFVCMANFQITSTIILRQQVSAHALT